MTSYELKLVSNDAIIRLTINDVVARWLVDTLLSGRFERFNEHKVHLFTPFNFQATPESLGHNYKVINVFKFLIILEGKYTWGRNLFEAFHDETC